MESELKAKWVAALRSGEFKQGRTTLYNSGDNSYCCLGVLGHLCGADEEWLDHRNYLTFDMAKRAGLSNANNPHGMDVQAELGAMNDGSITKDGGKDRKTFAQIADWIEENL